VPKSDAGIDYDDGDVEAPFPLGALRRHLEGRRISAEIGKSGSQDLEMLREPPDRSGECRDRCFLTHFRRKKIGENIFFVQKTVLFLEN
jgi:hypothetical protein